MGKYDYGDGRVEQDPNYMIFSNRNSNYPQQIVRSWWLTQFRRWGMVKAAPDYKGSLKRVIRATSICEAMKEMGVATKVAEEQTIKLFDGTFDRQGSGEVCRSFPIHSIALDDVRKRATETPSTETSRS